MSSIIKDESGNVIGIHGAGFAGVMDWPPEESVICDVNEDLVNQEMWMNSQIEKIATAIDPKYKSLSPEETKHDPVNHPKHYTDRVPGIECIEVTKHFNFCLGNAIKYIWRAGDKGDKIQDLEKAAWYIKCEIDSLKKEETCTSAR